MGLHIHGDLNRADTDEILHQIDLKFEQTGPILLLVAYDAEPRLISAEDLYDNLRFAKLASDKLVRMAVIGKNDWEKTWIALFGLFGGLQAQFFSKSEIKEALAWLSGQ